MCYSLYIFNDKHEIQGFFRPPPLFFLIACQEILDKSAPPHFHITHLKSVTKYLNKLFKIDR